MPMPRTVVHALHDAASRLSHKPALWTKKGGVYLPTSWQQYADRVRHFALGLHKLGFGPGKVMCILAFNREEWLVAELAAMAMGGTAVGIYTTSSPEQIEYILNHSGAEILLVENAPFVKTAKALRPKLKALKHLLVMDSRDAGEGVRAYQDVLHEGVDADESTYWDSVNALEEKGLATMIYTSGTTGNPKGVMLSHRNLTWTATKLLQSSPLVYGKEILLSYLPLSHIAEQQASIHIPIMGAFQVYFSEGLEKVPENLKEVRPTAFFAVPRVWEKFKAKAEARMKDAPPARQKILAKAREVTLERNQRLLRGERVPLFLEAQYQAASRVVLAQIKERIGFDRAHVFLTSAAPISLEVLEFFASVDIIIREIYGQSEVTGPTSVSTEQQTRLGRLGQPMLGVEVKIAEDGEICVRGENVCLGYFKDKEGTAELIDSEGWLHSGDVGEIDAEGFLRVTGRKKEILVTSGGKKTAPAFLEGLLKNITPIGNAMVIGEARNYLTALLPLDPEKLEGFCKEHGFPSDAKELVRHRGFLDYLQTQIEEQVNPKVARFEHIRKFHVLPHDFTTEGGELTPTLKVRRKIVEKKYAKEIESLYAGPEAKSA